MKFVIMAYYYSSERTYAFGPFSSEAAVNRFIKNDPEPDKHDEWQVIAINPQKDYNTGYEYSTW